MELFEKMATYVRVVEAGSLSAAARQLRMSSAAVSRQIATLEAHLRVRLLLRTTRRVVVTEEGRQYYESCLRILREVEKAQAISHRDEMSGRLIVSAPVSFGLARVVPYLRPLMSRHPGLRVDLRLEDVLINLALEGVDIALRVGAAPPDSTEVVSHRLSSFRRVIVASPRYLKARGAPKTPEALAKHEALTFLAGASSEMWTLISEEREASVQINAVFRSNSIQALRGLALEGAGMTVLPEWFVAEDLRRRALHRVLPGWRSHPVTVSALHRVELRGAARVRGLIDHLRAVYAGPESVG